MDGTTSRAARRAGTAGDGRARTEPLVPEQAGAASRAAVPEQNGAASRAAVPEQARTASRTTGRSCGPGLSRRSFLGGVGGVAAVGLTGGLAGGLVGPLLAARPAAAAPPPGTPVAPGARARQRAQAAYQVRADAAKYERDLPLPAAPTNGDEQLDGHIGSYSKGLPHDEFGEVDEQAYAALLTAVASGRDSDFEAVPLGGVAKLGNPQSAWCFGLDAPDSHHLDLPAPPALRSAERAAEMVEVYWQALTRDVPFTAYATDTAISEAATELSGLPRFSGPREHSQVTPGTLFRGSTPGELTGPYVSQFLWKTVPWGPGTIDQRYRSAVAGTDHGTDHASWLAMQRGAAASGPPVLSATPAYIHDGRSLGSYVHADFSYQAFLSAALILLATPGTTDRSNPYVSHGSRSGYSKQAPFTTFGGPFVLDLVARVAKSALLAAWSQKWLVHRTLRPEALAGRLHHQLVSGKAYRLHSTLGDSVAVVRMLARPARNVLLPLAYPEGSPTHPSYPAGHAAVAGACVTVLKACMDEDAVLPDPVEASGDGSVLQAYTGGPLRVGGELNKLASNISLGRDTAGVHYRSDGTAGMLLGEQVALGLLTEMRAVYNEPFGGFSLTRFDGTRVTV